MTAFVALILPITHPRLGRHTVLIKVYTRLQIRD